MKELLAKYILTALVCSFKYVVGALGAVSAGMNFIETMLCTVGGGMLGVVVYLYLWDGILFLYHRIRPPKPRQFRPVGKHRRRMLKIIVKYEVAGIAALTPILLSVPVGTVLAASIQKNKWRIKLYMLVSFTCYSILIYFFSGFIRSLIP